MTSPSVLPVDGRGSRRARRSPRRGSSAGTPPASWKSSIRNSPAGRMFAITGTSREMVEALDGQRHAGPAGHGDEVDDRVGGAAQRHVGDDGVSNAARVEDGRRPDVLPHQLHGSAAGRRRPCGRGRMHRRDRRRARAASCPAPRWRRHRRRRAHRHARARASARCLPRPGASAHSSRLPALRSFQYFQTSVPLPSSWLRQCRAASVRRARRSRAGPARSRPSAAPARSCRSRPSAPRRRSGASAGSPRPPAPAGCDRTSPSA